MNITITQTKVNTMNIAHTFDFNTGTLRPIKDAGTLPRGSKLYYANMSCSARESVVLDPEFTNAHGQKAISETGAFTYPSRDAVEYPGGWNYCLDENDEPIILTEEEIAAFIVEAEARKIVLEREGREAASKKAIVREQKKKQHLANYGHLLTRLEDSKRSESATAGANVKKLLKLTFPGVNFRVRSDYNSINVSWENGPCGSCDAIEKIESLFNTGAYDAYEDYHYSIENVFAEIFGGANFVFFQRNISGDKYLETAKELGIEGVTVTDHNNIEGCSEAQRDRIYEVTRKKNFVEAVDLNSKNAKVVNSAQLSAVEGVTLTENDAKNGVEIRFPGKPSPAVIASLKANKFRWSRRGGFWFSKRTVESLAFARELSGV